ncbi:hypothetical protein LCGC14_2383890, partial [marine sediment metagenome]
WWHSHGYSDTRWSLDDDRTFKRLSDFLNGFCVGIVVSIADNKNSRFRIDMKHKSGDTYTIDNILPNIIEKKKIGGIINSVLSGIDIREIKAKVVSSRDAEVTWDTCSLCKGSGVVFRKRIELENEAGVELNSTGDGTDHGIGSVTETTSLVDRNADMTDGDVGQQGPQALPPRLKRHLGR